MARGPEPAVRDGVEKRLPPIECRVDSDREPERARAAQGQAEEHRDQEDLKRADQPLARVEQVSAPERRRENHRRRPEADSRCERELRVPAERELLEEPHESESNQPEEPVLHDRTRREREPADVVAAEEGDTADDGADEAEPPEHADPEVLAERAPA